MGDAKAATKPSPVWLNKNPSYASIAVRNTLSCTTSAARIACASASHRRVEPSTSVNRNVTTPEGAAAAGGADTPAESHKPGPMKGSFESRKYRVHKCLRRAK